MRSKRRILRSPMPNEHPGYMYAFPWDVAWPSLGVRGEEIFVIFLPPPPPPETLDTQATCKVSYQVDQHL